VDNPPHYGIIVHGESYIHPIIDTYIATKLITLISHVTREQNSGKLSVCVAALLIVTSLVAHKIPSTSTWVVQLAGAAIDS
jgi:hypothetical protein